MVVLIADASPIIRKVIVTNLSRLGIPEGQIVEAVDGDMAMQKFNAIRSLDMVIVDFQLPVISGIDLVEKMTETGRHPVCAIVITHNILTPAQHKAVEMLKVHGMVKKPFDLDEFMKVIEPLMHAIESHDLPPRGFSRPKPAEVLELLGTPLEEARIEDNRLVLEFDQREILVDFEKFMKLIQVRNKPTESADSSPSAEKAEEPSQSRKAS